ncbi:FIG00442920: hypothetical protein [hydrothermal vent metagenome]|uniref:MAPEG family protein n=1 Tax=hydrothermal vent metagenome TaxID=652676 RepID=A0A3B0S3U6_9ZZZZ
MTPDQTPELFWLAAVTALTGVLWMPHIMQLIVQMGLFKAMQEPTGVHPHASEWPHRATRAQYNAVENLAIFAPLALLIALQGLGDSLTAMAAMVFFWARLVHFIVYVLKLPYIRTIAFLIGFGCQAVLALRLFGLL